MVVNTMSAQATPAVGLFGKLPSHPDFVRLNAGSPLARSLDQWMQEGLSQMRLQLGDDWEAGFDAAPPLCFAYRDKDPTAALVGVCRPGRDQTGRRYPFSIFAFARLGRGGAGFHLLPQAYSRFLKAARRLATADCADGIDNQKAASIMNLSGTLPQNLVEIQSRFDRSFNDVTMGSFWRGLYPDFGDERKYLVIKNLFAALVPRRGQDPMRFGFGLRFPVAADPDVAAVQSAFWMLLCGAAVGEKPLEQSVLFWRADSTVPVGECCLFFHPPAPSSMASLLVRQRETDSIWDLETMGAEKANRVRAELGVALAEALDDPDQGIKGFIQAIKA